MRMTRRPLLALGSSALLTLLLLLPQAPVQAHHAPGHGGGPGGGGEEPPPEIDGGTIYYFDEDTRPSDVYRVDPYGANDTLVDTSAATEFLLPSKTLHAGSRWFVTIRAGYAPGFFPGGASDGRLFELDLVREGDPTPVPLTSNGAACIQMWGRGPGVRFDWVPDADGRVDGAIAFLGSRWVDSDGDGSCDQPVDGGIFRGALSIDATGGVSFAQPTAPELVLPLLTTSGLNGTSTTGAEFDIAPDGRRFAYVESDGSEAVSDLWVVDASGARSLVFGDRPSRVAWSPDGQRLAFTGATSDRRGADKTRGTYTIAADGSDLRQVADAKIPKKPSAPFVFHDTVDWSPTGAQILFTERVSEGFPLAPVRTVYRVNADGSGLFEVSPGNGRFFGLGWSVD